MEYLNCWSEENKAFISLLQAMLPVILTVFAIYIAYQQYQTNRRKLKLDLFDKRLMIFEATKKLMLGVLNSSSYNLENQTEFNQGTRGAQFLFGEDIKVYLDEIWSRFIDLETWLEDSKLSEHALERTETKKWFISELRSIDQKFIKYMKLER